MPRSRASPRQRRFSISAFLSTGNTGATGATGARNGTQGVTAATARMGATGGTGREGLEVSRVLGARSVSQAKPVRRGLPA